MAISWNEIKHRAIDFSCEWKVEGRERVSVVYNTGARVIFKRRGVIII